MTKILRPGDLHGQPLPERPVAAPVGPQLTEAWVSAYDRMPASHAKYLCATDSVFNQLAEQLHVRRYPQGEHNDADHKL